MFRRAPVKPIQLCVAELLGGPNDGEVVEFRFQDVAQLPTRLQRGEHVYRWFSHTPTVYGETARYKLEKT